MIKITEIEAYLSSPHSAEIELYNISPSTIGDLQRLYGGEVYFSPNTNNTWYIVNGENTSVTLNTNKKN